MPSLRRSTSSVPTMWARDLFARVLYGGRVSLFVGMASTVISVAIGIPLGLIAGYFRGIAESIIMRTADAFMSFPSMVLILVLVAVFGPSILTVTVVIGVLGWTSIAKLIYGNVLSIRECEYVQAAKAVGTRTSKILFSEVLPNAITPVWANISFRVAGARADGVFPELSGHGCPDTAGLLGQHHLCGPESAGADGPPLGLAALRHLHHSGGRGVQLHG